MNAAESVSPAQSVRSAPRKLSRDTVFLVGDLLPLCDFTGVLLAAWIATLLYAAGFESGGSAMALRDTLGRVALAGAVLAPFILCERAFVSFASGGQTAALIRCFAVRFLMFAGVVTVIGFSSRQTETLPRAWLLLWLASSLGVTVMVRGLLVTTLRRLERQGVLTETVAVVGAGAVADRLIRDLKNTRGNSLEILGVFDERRCTDAGCENPPTGSIGDLIERGRSRAMDWILIAQAEAGGGSQQALVHRLKSLAVPIGLCTQYRGLDDEARSLPRLARTYAAVETVLPRWILTLLGLPLMALRTVRDGTSKRLPSPKLACTLDNYDLERFAPVAARFGLRRYGYVVTPNADHLIRLHREPSFRTLYAEAAYVLLDSRFIAKLLRFTRKVELPVCTGADLTATLLNDVAADDRLVLIGGSDAQAARLSARYGLKQLAHFNPPMGFIRDPAAVETCLRFIEAHSPFRYCLLAVGSPQQEIIAQQLKARGSARGLALCIGASINFLTGEEQRAPLWMQRSGIEWLFRLLQAPGRMAGRYLVNGPRVFALLRRTEMVLRTAVEPPPRPIIPAIWMPAYTDAPILRPPATVPRDSPTPEIRTVHNESAPGP